MRREVLGDEYVDRAMKNADDFNKPFQEMVSEYCWGLCWTDETLSRRERSILNLGMIAALGKMHEFELHSARRDPQRPHQGRAARGADPDRGLLRHPGRRRLLPHREAGHRRAESLIAQATALTLNGSRHHGWNDAGKVVVVTGAGGGIGRDIALAMARERRASRRERHRRVARPASFEDSARRRRRRSCARSRRPAARRSPNTDSVSSWASAERIVQCAMDHFGRIDGVVNNAGILRDRIFHKMTEDDWRSVIAVHLDGSFFVSRAAADHMRNAEQRRVRAHDVDLGADRQLRPGELFGGQARHRRALEEHRARHGALQRALELHRAFRVEPHDELDPGEHAGRERARRAAEEDGAAQGRADGGVPRERRRGEGDGTDLRRARERDHALQPAAADPLGASHARMDARSDRARSRCRAMQKQFYPLDRSPDVVSWDPI